jgi:hypothetical protein
LTREFVLYWSAWPRVVQEGVDLLEKYLTDTSEQSRVVASPSQSLSQVVLLKFSALARQLGSRLTEQSVRS